MNLWQDVALVDPGQDMVNSRALRVDAYKVALTLHLSVEIKSTSQQALSYQCLTVG